MGQYFATLDLAKSICTLDEEVNSVDLRDVHAFVLSKQQFSNWASNRLADFLEGVDFIVNKIINKENNMVVSVDYLILPLGLSKSI